MIHNRLVAAVCFSSAAPFLWWVFVLVAPSFFTAEVDLFLFVDRPQECYWYLYYSSHYLSVAWLLFTLKSLQPFTHLNTVFKYAAYLQLLFLLEYWTFGGTLPMLPFAFCLFLLQVEVLMKHIKSGKNIHSN